MYPDGPNVSRGRGKIATRLQSVSPLLRTDWKAPGATDVSVIITAHREGRLAHRSVRSALRSIDFAERDGVACEMVAVIDNADGPTQEYFARYRQHFSQVSEVCFGDAAPSRNHGVDLARGRFVAFLDADDLFSENWLRDAFRVAEGHAGCQLVLHPEFSVYFGETCHLFQHRSLTRGDPECFNMLEANYWTALAFVEREYVQEIRYAPDEADAGFGYEDWYWNCETLARGAEHLVVPTTAHFIRVKAAGSRVREATQAGVTLWPSALFEPRPSADEAAPPDGELIGAPVGSRDGTDDLTSHEHRGRRGTRATRHALQMCYRAAKPVARGLLRNRPRAKRAAEILRESAREVFSMDVRYPPPPEWLLREWQAAAHLEPAVIPSRLPLDEVPRHVLPNNPVVRMYPDLYEAMGSSPTHVFVLPWLRRGGADLEAIHYMTAVAEDEANRVVCITTEDADSPWVSRIPERVRVVQLGRVAPNTRPEERAPVLLRLLLQKEPRVIHNINSPLCYDVFSRHGKALSQRSRLIVSAFCEEVFDDGRVGGYALDALPRCYDSITAIVTDNRSFANRLCEMYAFDPNRFRVAYCPGPRLSGPYQESRVRPCFQVLWAGRLARQKRPDVLAEVARRLQSSLFRFHVFGSPDTPGSARAYTPNLVEMPNVTYHGEFDAFHSIPHRNFDAFLYTSEWDGLPNVLLEATAAGLPIVAPDIGGIAEFISEHTGYLVSSADAVDEYVAALEAIRANGEAAHVRVQAAQALLSSRHSQESFRRTLSSIPDYLAPDPENTPAS